MNKTQEQHEAFIAFKCQTPFNQKSDIGNIMESFIKTMSIDMSRKRDDLIKQKLTDKGYDTDDISKQRRFPKICQVICDKWTYVFADNGTIEGDFIVAFKEAEITDQLKDPYKITAEFKWQDTDCSAVSIERNKFYQQ